MAIGTTPASGSPDGAVYIRSPPCASRTRTLPSSAVASRREPGENAAAQTIPRPASRTRGTTGAVPESRSAQDTGSGQSITVLSVPPDAKSVPSGEGCQYGLNRTARRSTSPRCSSSTSMRCTPRAGRPPPSRASRASTSTSPPTRSSALQWVSVRPRSRTRTRGFGPWSTRLPPHSPHLPPVAPF